MCMGATPYHVYQNCLVFCIYKTCCFLDGGGGRVEEFRVTESMETNIYVLTTFASFFLLHVVWYGKSCSRNSERTYKNVDA